MRAVDPPAPKVRFDLKASLVDEIEAAHRALQGEDAAVAVHQARVRLKRARALARLARQAAPAEAQALNARARAIMAQLGAARDLAALEACARDTLVRAKTAEAQAALQRAAEALKAEREEIEAQGPARPLRAVARLKTMALRWPEITPKAAARGAERLAERAAAAWKEARGRAKVEARHTWRKREKDRLYAVELMGAAWPQELPRRARAAKRLGQALGLERDVILLSERLQGQNWAGPALPVLERRRRRLAQRADRLGEALHRDY